MHKRTLSDAAVSVHRIMEPSTWHLSDRKRDAMAGIALRCDCRHAEIVTATPTKAVSTAMPPVTSLRTRR